MSERQANQSFLPLLVVMYGAAFLAGFNENLVNMGLMSIMGEYGIGSTTAQWLVTGYMIVATVVVTAMAFLYRRIKLRALFFSGVAFTAAGSILGLLAPNFALLMVARLVQAVGSGLFIPMMMNTILVVTPKNRLGQFMSIGGCMITFGPAFAPVVCGSLVTALGWHSVFVVPIVAIAVLGIAGAMFVRDLENAPASLDVISLALSGVFLFTLSFGLVQLAANTVVGIVSLALAVACAAVFTVRQLRIPNPLIDMTPMSSAKFWPAVVLVVISMLVMFSNSVLLPLYFEGALGMSAFTAGIVILFPVLANAGCTLLGGRLMDKHGEWPLLPLGIALATVGLALFAFMAADLDAVVMFVAALFVYCGIGLVFSPAQTAGLRTLPPQKNPFGVALMTTFIQVAACVGPAMFTGIMSGVQESSADGEALATAQGYAAAMEVAAVIALLGLVLAFVYALAAARRARQAAEQRAHQVPAAQPVQGDFGATGLAGLITPEPFTIPADALVSQAMRAFVENKVSGMPLVDGDGRVAGFVSDGDIMRYLVDSHPLVTNAYSLLEAAGAETMDGRLKELVSLPVSAIATEKCVVLPANATIDEACRFLSQHRLKKVPVVEDGRVVGVVSRSDVLRYAMESVLDSQE